MTFEELQADCAARGHRLQFDTTMMGFEYSPWGLEHRTDPNGVTTCIEMHPRDAEERAAEIVAFVVAQHDEAITFDVLDRVVRRQRREIQLRNRMPGYVNVGRVIAGEITDADRVCNLPIRLVGGSLIEVKAANS